jgi:hypothetical protein
MSRARPRASLLRTIGGLDDPLRGDERSSRIWCEAAAVAQQVQFTAAIMVAAVMSWAGGRQGVYWSVALLSVSAAGNVTIALYVSRSGIPGIAVWRRLASPRGGLTLFLVLTWALGAARTLGGAATSLDRAVGFTVGLILVVVGSTALAHRRARNAGLPDDDDFNR